MHMMFSYKYQNANLQEISLFVTIILFLSILSIMCIISKDMHIFTIGIRVLGQIKT